MRVLGQLAALALALLLALAAPAYADHMTGTYAGTGISQGTTLNLTQQGFNISGDFTGVLNGTFYGQTDGGDYAEGFLTESGTTYTYYLNWAPDQLTITIYDTMGNQLAYVFAPQGGTIVEPHAPTTTTTLRPGDDPTVTQMGDLTFHVFEGGVQSGPFTLEEMIGKVQSGEVRRDTLVWLAGTPEWVPAENINLLADAMPPPAPPPPPVAKTYYALIGGTQVGPVPAEEIIARIAAGEIGPDTLLWTEGLDAWAQAATFEEFAEALAPPVPPPPPTPPPPPAPPAPPPPPEAPAPPVPLSTDTSALDPGAIERILRRHVTDIGTDEQVLAAVQCLMREFDVLTVEQQRAMLETDFEVSREEEDAIEAAHPGFGDRGRACALLAYATEPAPPPEVPTPPVADAPPVADTPAPPVSVPPPGGDPLEVAVKDYLQRQGAGGATDQIADCIMSAFSVLTPAERQMVADARVELPQPQADALMQAHPGMMERMGACVQGLGRQFGG